MIRVGLDVGSTTAKLVAIDSQGSILHTQYMRHNACARTTVLKLLGQLLPVSGSQPVSLRITGSVGMGLSERYSLPFVQEVVAAAGSVGLICSEAKTMIDIGGEDAKMVFFKDGSPAELRMNGNCAGGTGAFIDQMAILLGTSTEELGQMACCATAVYPIASRCGVFSKTDVQNLIAKNAKREDVAASIFHAVAVQTVTTLARGCDIEPPVMMCGGPLTFIPALRQAFADYLHLSPADIILPQHSALLPAMGAAMADVESQAETLQAIIGRITSSDATEAKSPLKPIFDSKVHYAQWQQRMASHSVRRADANGVVEQAYLGIDSGSTTTKIVAINDKREIIYSYYRNNGGNPINAVAQGLRQLAESHPGLKIAGSCATGYGEDLTKAAFSLDGGIIETIAHYMAASHIDPQVSFILDIGGQDMKAIFVDKGIIDRIELNEACSSGCGSFIETFARTLGYSAQQFAQLACHATAPADLGTRCTVFMNSKVKQVMRQGASVADIAAGLAYSVVKNCLHKVLKLKDISILGKHIVVQGGTMRNDAIVAALEQLTGTQVARCDCPELMGAYGCALYALSHPATAAKQLDQMLRQSSSHTTQQHNCHGCENQCAVLTYTFAGQRRYHSGNRCERIFNNGGTAQLMGENVYKLKEQLLFDRPALPHPATTVGIPRVLGIYEEYPFWHTLFTECGIGVVLSRASSFDHYEQCARKVMSDNICFPAKLAHSHIANLQSRASEVERIFMPFVIHQDPTQGDQNSYNCPIVTGYSAVIKSAQPSSIPIDSPAISFKDRSLLQQQCYHYLHSTFGIDRKTAAQAFAMAEAAQEEFHSALAEACGNIFNRSRQQGQLCILLAGRPYHTDPLIQHRVSDLLAAMGINVISDDIVRCHPGDLHPHAHYLQQWAYPNRILRAAQWCAMQPADVQMVQMTSFGCGPDAFLNDEVRDLLLRHHKSPTLLKLDDISNLGSMKLRVRSMVESLRLAHERPTLPKPIQGLLTTPAYDNTYRQRKILVPFFTPFISPLVPAVMRLAGYVVENLPMSDQQSGEWGLRYANNEVCYPATLIVGDIIKAFKTRRHDPARCAVAITQTGGQCRASNYVPLIKKALVDAGYPCVPVVSLTFGDEIDNDQPAFHINWARLLPVALRAILYSDCIAKFYHATAPRESKPGAAKALVELYLHHGASLIEARRSNQLLDCIADAAEAFNAICTHAECPRVGIVGEIFLKFNNFAQRNVTQWLIDHHIEVVPPVLIDFFMQSFVNRRANVKAHIERRSLSDVALPAVFKLVQSKIERVNRVASRFSHFVPLGNIFDQAQAAEQVISLNAQFGEGWLLPAEVITMARQGVHNVVSLQPFGCIANHIVSKGVEKRIKALYPDVNLLSLDFDSGVSDVNITNRLLLFIDKLKTHEYSK